MKWSARRPRTWAIAVLMAPALVTLSCSGSSPTETTQNDAGEPQHGGTATISLVDAIDSWNPQQALLQSSFQMFAQVYSSLLRASPDGTKLSPALASDYKYDPAARTITFTLDPAAQFSDGSPVTSSDVKFSFGLWRASELYGNYFETIRDVATPDDRTAVFELTEPDVTLPKILSTTNASIYPANYGGRTEKDYWAKPIGAGPFQIDSEVPGQSISLSRNTHYYRPNLPMLDKLDYSVVSDQNQQLLQFQSGALDIVNEVEPTLIGQYPPDSTVSAPSSGLSVLMTQTRDAPLDNADLRRAIALAINHTDLIAGGYGGQALQATTLLPPIIPGVKPCPSCDWAKHDLEAAKQLVAKSGYAGQNLEFVVASASGTETLVAQAIQPMLAEAGIKMSISAVPTSTAVDRMEKGDFQLTITTYAAQAPTPVDPLGFFASTGYLYTQFGPGADATAAELKAVHQSDSEDQVSTATERFEKQAHASAAAIPLAQPNVVFAVSKDLHGFVPAPYTTYIADELWVTR